MSEDMVLDASAEDVEKPKRQRVVKAAADKPNVAAERVWITLDENQAIPKSGQFFGINGMGYILKPGKKAYVPKGIVDILDNATQMDPVVNPDTLQVEGYVERMRFPYRLHPNG